MAQVTVFEVAHWPLHVVHRNTFAHRVGDLFDVGPIGRDDGIVAAKSSFGYCNVDGVIESAASDQRADLSRLPLAEFLDFAALQQSRQLVLRSAAPCLGEHATWDRGDKPTFDRSAVHCPHQPVVSFGRDERAGVVGESGSGQALLAACSLRSRSRRASPAERSSAVSWPASASHSQIPRRPSRRSSLSSAADESHAEKDTPSSAAAAPPAQLHCR